MNTETSARAPMPEGLTKIMNMISKVDTDVANAACRSAAIFVYGFLAANGQRTQNS